jgi:hypothetical protein
MSCGSDGFGIADLRRSDSGSGRDLGRGSSSSWDKWTSSRRKDEKAHR